MGGNFEELPFEDEAFDIVMAQDAILHSAQKMTVFEESVRVLKPGGDFIFTDPMQADDCPEGVLQPVLERIHLDSMGSVAKYRDYAQKLGLEEIQVIEEPEQLTNHYSNVRKKLQKNYDEILKKVSQDYVDKMIKGLGHWVEAGENGYLNWGFLHFRKKK